MNTSCHSEFCNRATTSKHMSSVQLLRYLHVRSYLSASYHHHLEDRDRQQLLDNLLLQFHCQLLPMHQMLWQLQTQSIQTEMSKQSST